MVVFTSQPFGKTRQIVLSPGVLDMGNQFAASAHEIHSPS